MTYRVGMDFESLHILISVFIFAVLISCMACAKFIPIRQITQIKPSIDASGTGRVIENFQTADLIMKAGEVHVFTFRAYEGDYFNIEPVATPSDLDLRLRLNTYQGEYLERSGEGTLVAQNDNGGLGVNPRFKDLELDAGTNYKLTVSSYGKISGAYSITFYITDAPRYASSGLPILLISTITALLLLLIASLFFTFWQRIKLKNVLSHEDRQEQVYSPLEINDVEVLEDVRAQISQLMDVNEEIRIVRREKERSDSRVEIYRNGYDIHRLKAGFLEIIQAYENADKALVNDESERWLEVIHLHIEQFLEDVGVESFAPDIGSLFREATNTKNIKTVITDDPSIAGTIAEVNSLGYWTRFPEIDSDKHVIREANVTIYKFG